MGGRGLPEQRSVDYVVLQPVHSIECGINLFHRTNAGEEDIPMLLPSIQDVQFWSNAIAILILVFVKITTHYRSTKGLPRVA